MAFTVFTLTEHTHVLTAPLKKSVRVTIAREDMVNGHGSPSTKKGKCQVGVWRGIDYFDEGRWNSLSFG